MKFDGCYIAGDYAALIRAGSGKTVDSIVFDQCTSAGYAILGYQSGEQAYMRNIVYRNSTLFTDDTQVTPASSYPTQNTYTLLLAQLSDSLMRVFCQSLFMVLTQ